MKSFILSILLLGSINSLFAQFKVIPIDSVSQKVLFSEVVPVDTTSKAVLYSRCREWFVHTFKSADDVIQMDDKESGKIIGKGFSDIILPPIAGVIVKTRLYYTISIGVKENRYRYEISDIFYKSYATAQAPSQTTYPEDWYNPESKMYKSNGKEKSINRGYYDKTLEAINSLILSLKRSVSSPKKTDDGW